LKKPDPEICSIRASQEPASEPAGDLAFGRFQVLRRRGELLADGQPIKLGRRAFDVLMALIDARGAVLSKDALMARVWPERVVEENNLQSQISALRAAFGVDRELIRTVSGRGYQFTGKIQISSALPDVCASAGLPVVPEVVSPATNLPEPISELIGRDDELGVIMGLTVTSRLVTLTGPGGIGKTRLALAAARRTLKDFADGVWLAELAPLSDAGLVPGAVAAAVGLELSGGSASPDRVAAALGRKQMLIVLDNCEHVVGAAAIMAEALLRASPAVHVIATSREPLKAEGEWVYAMPPLSVPAEGAEDEGDPLGYGAVRLFLERARAAEPNFAPDRPLATVIAAICRRLDGIPLAIELAAARVATLGIEALTARLDDRFRLLTGGRRTALPRHQTLRATLDWSYELLTEPEHVVLRRLAVFAGVFNLKAASAIVAGPDISSPDVVEGLLSLVAKSLVSAEVGGPIAGYRLLHTTRAYALEKLDESGERERFARRHAEYHHDLFERAETEWETRPSSEWLTGYGQRIDNLRAAIDWAFSPGGDASIGVALTTAAIHLWMHLSLLEECRGRVEQALAVLGNETKQDARREMKLYAARGVSLIYTRGAMAGLGEVWTRVLEIAESVEDAEYQLRSLWGLWVFHSANGQHAIALDLAQRFHALAVHRPNPNDRFFAERLIGLSRHTLGDHAGARRHFERVLADYAGPDDKSLIVRYQIDLRVAARVPLAMILWLQGFPDQAMRAAERAVEDARGTNHAISLSYALGLAACPIALLNGDLDAAEHYIGMLLDQATCEAPAHWRAFGYYHKGVLVAQRGDITGLHLLRSALDEIRGTGASLWPLMLHGEIAEALGRAGNIADGLAAIDEAIDRCERTQEGWATAELMRVKGELLLLQGAPGSAAAAEDHFRQAIDWARRQGALAWELRAGTSLARMLQDQGRATEAVALLWPIYDRFAEGFDTADFKAAEELLVSELQISTTALASLSPFPELTVPST
jgi:predicted ATPase/DNA-binding winged helix-turn-helix (wHTH) protein